MGYKLEMHLHPLGNSWCGATSPADIVKLYKEAGYDGIVVTNHYNRFLYKHYLGGNSFEDKSKCFFRAFNELKDNEEGLDVFFGLEIAVGNDHYHKGLHPRCAEVLIYGITPAEFYALGEGLLHVSYKGLREIASDRGWLLMQAHPFRERTKRLPMKYLDGLEVFNGNPRHVNRNELAEKRANKYNVLKVAGSDFHKPEDLTVAMVFERKPENEKDLTSLIKSGKFEIVRK